MPLDSGSIDKIALHCSFEHFEGTSDSGFIREMDRILAPGGRCCILPLYLNQHHAIQSGPRCVPWGGLAWDGAAEIYLRSNWGERFGRFYSLQQLQSRVLSQLRRCHCQIFHICNSKEIDPRCYLEFAAVFICPTDECVGSPEVPPGDLK